MPELLQLCCAMNNKLKAHAALLLSGLLFGANYWIAKEIMPVPLLPRQIIFIRVFVAAIGFWVVAGFVRTESVQRKDLFIIALASVLGVAVNQIFFFEGLNLSNPVDAAILHATCPILVLLFATWTIRERIIWVNVAGVVIGATGAILLILSGLNQAVFAGSLKGNLFIMINNTAYAMYLVLIKPVMNKYHPFTVMKWIFIFGFLAVAPFTTHTMADLAWDQISGGVLYALVYVVLGTTMVAYLLTTYSLQHVKASAAGYYIYLQPVMAAIVGLVWFEGALTWMKVVAAVCIFLGVYFVNLRKPPFMKRV